MMDEILEPDIKPDKTKILSNTTNLTSFSIFLKSIDGIMYKTSQVHLCAFIHKKEKRVM